MADTQQPATVVREFLEALEREDVDAAMALLTEDAVWINVSLPAVRGRARIEKLCRMGQGKVGFRVHFHAIAADGDVVLTDRSDALRYGPVEQRFWVHGRFELRDGRIAVWRDAFDWRDYLISFLRGVAGAISPGLNRPWPLKR